MPSELSEEKVRIPSYLNYPQGVFKDVEHYKSVVRGILQALAPRFEVTRNSDKTATYLFDGIKVEFSPLYEEEEIYLDYINSKIVLRVPSRDGEDSGAVLKRRMHYLSVLSREIEAMKTIGVTQIYLSLTPAGQHKIENS